MQLERAREGSRAEGSEGGRGGRSVGSKEAREMAFPSFVCYCLSVVILVCQESFWNAFFQTEQHHVWDERHQFLSTFLAVFAAWYALTYEHGTIRWLQFLLWLGADAVLAVFLDIVSPLWSFIVMTVSCLVILHIVFAAIQEEVHLHDE